MLLLAAKKSVAANAPYTLTLVMGSQGPPRRPFCLRCSKPARLCLCGRIKSPPVDNPIAVTILQHSLEKDHPLNSTRLALLGLRNIAVTPVTDVNFHARFRILPLINPHQNDSNGSRSRISYSDCPITSDDGDGDGDGDGDDDAIAIATVTKSFSNYSITCSPLDIQITVERSAKPNISWVLDSPVGRTAASNGFSVEKLQRKKPLPNGSEEEFQDFKEFELLMPAGSALLFPSENSVGLDAVDFEVKQLIVLDGTWGKATRMYHENPWLQLLPHLRLQHTNESLYSEVRHQPKAGCLSTIESIVYGLKGLGHQMEGLDNLLEVFESMVEDQRRCKDEKFRAMSLS